MSKDYDDEIRQIRKELDELKSLIRTNGETHQIVIKYPDTGEPVSLPAISQNKEINKLCSELAKTTEINNDTGTIGYFGNFSASGNTSYWCKEAVSTNTLLSLNDDKKAETVLTSIGNGQRLAILLALLKKPMTVVQLVESLQFNTTGQVYHHLKSLILADLIVEDERSERGTYFVKPHRVQGIIMLLAGVNDLIDTKYTSGSWE